MRTIKRKDLPLCRPRSSSAFEQTWRMYVDTLKAVDKKPTKPLLSRKEALEKMLIRCYKMDAKDLGAKKVLR